MALSQNLKILLAIVLFLNIALWFSARDIQAHWNNIPPPPGKSVGTMMGLGDTFLAYRSYGLVLQNMGDIGGRTTSLKEYNYKHLGAWLTLLHYFDPYSDYLPFLAAYYFSAPENPEQLKHIVDYLEIAGDSESGEKWRWLAQAVFIARFKMQDMDRALELAKKLANLKNPDIPGWARQMPANVLNARGEKEAAYELLVNMLKDSADKLNPNEVNATVAYICEQVLTEEQAKNNSLCRDDY